ncbi:MULTISPECIES: 50S ribosomal protein L10 [Helicobacter]|uniref:Large ribosomal subunit protein uL10 n=1 Tax=Helicobacter colisuis TaxID=2949739 RepID=A0ABT0TV00_9HELI|nr:MULTISPECIES: 50S ribosomal protein L10 [Helicobacter]MCI2235412.1 50S ribosomal protein L10 [Helicobacter sp. CaF467b]MCI7046875.1 50S ribosomal protein L10 [Helicobacter sp.]MCI7764826.1 50S ribosomal protein L10 [Helicobacter sp.]MCL9819745.1 50S ribosomal protein L10 [Helicobacter colisuis]MCL9820983.1 50S ribosomal protein L10 [Helicobacter colisuis]
MTKVEKNALIESLSAEFQASNAIIVCDYKGLTVKELEVLRAEMRAQNAKVQVVKNTLASIALKNSNVEGLELKENNIFLWSEDQISLSKVVCKFSNSVGGKLVIKSGYFEGELVDSKHIEAVSKLPSKEELIGMLLSVWTAPARYFVTGLDNLRKQKEGE